MKLNFSFKEFSLKHVAVLAIVLSVLLVVFADTGSSWLSRGLWAWAGLGTLKLCWAKLTGSAAGWKSLADRIGGQLKDKWLSNQIVGTFSDSGLSYSIISTNVSGENYLTHPTVVVSLPDIVPKKAALSPSLGVENEIMGDQDVFEFVWSEVALGDEQFDANVSQNGLVPGDEAQLLSLLSSDLRQSIQNELIMPASGPNGRLVKRQLKVVLPYLWDGESKVPEVEDGVIQALERLQRLGTALVNAYTEFSPQNDSVSDRLLERAKSDPCEPVRHKSLLHLIEMTPDHTHPWPLTVDEAQYVFNHARTTDVVVGAIERLEGVGDAQLIKVLRSRAQENKRADWHPRLEQAITAMEDRLSGGSMGGLSLADDVGQNGDLSLADGGVDAGALDLIDVPTPENSDQGPESHQAPDGIKG